MGVRGGVRGEYGCCPVSKLKHVTGKTTKRLFEIHCSGFNPVIYTFVTIPPRPTTTTTTATTSFLFIRKARSLSSAVDTSSRYPYSGCNVHHHHYHH